MESENRHEFDATLDTFAHPRYELIPTGEIFDGAEQVADYYLKSRAVFPDQRNENTLLHCTDDGVIAEFDLLGTHEGELRGVPGTGREFRCRMCAIFEFEPGTDRIVCERVYFDQMTIAQQIFAEQQPGS
jgi:predicted ester cyclase